MTEGSPQRAHWKSKIGFILAAAGSAVGLGNVWKFPYIAGENGGGAFVLIYLVCIALVGLPIMIGEIMLGRMSQRSAVGAFKVLAGPRSPWRGVGAMGVVCGFFLLSYYSIVAGWALHYTWLSVSGGIAGGSPEEMTVLFGDVAANPTLNVSWHLVFMGLTIAVVIGGIQKGIERWARILMPALLLMMVVLLIEASQTEGFSQAIDFVFGSHTDQLTRAGVLEALGHSFFTLSLGMGAMITYGSYLSRDSSLVANSVAISFLDTIIALLACMILFPITFTYGMEPAGGPGLVFQNIPIAFAQMPGGDFLSFLFFALLVFAALTSAISLLEVVASYFIDERGWSRARATITWGGLIALFGVPSALSGGEGFFGKKMEVATGRNWFDTFDYLVSNWLLPLGGLGICLFCAYCLSDATRRESFQRHSTAGALYSGWVLLLRYFVPVVIVAIVLHKLGALAALGLL